MRCTLYLLWGNLNFLLETHVLIWAIYQPQNLSVRVKRLLDDPANELFVSYAAVWELLNKVGRGRLLVAGMSVEEVFKDIQALGVTLLPVSMDNILSAASLPHLHSDPFDRMFIAKALAEGVPLITVDPKIWQYPLETIWN